MSPQKSQNFHGGIGNPYTPTYILYAHPNCSRQSLVPSDTHRPSNNHTKGVPGGLEQDSGAMTRRLNTNQSISGLLNLRNGLIYPKIQELKKDK